MYVDSERLFSRKRRGKFKHQILKKLHFVQHNQAMFLSTIMPFERKQVFWRFLFFNLKIK